MAKATRKNGSSTRRTTTGRATTGRGRSGGGGGGGRQVWGNDIPKMTARSLISGLMSTDKLLFSALEKHQQTMKELQPIAKLHGLELTSNFGTGTRGTPRTVKTARKSAKATTRARTGRRSGSQQEPLTATA